MFEREIQILLLINQLFDLQIKSMSHKNPGSRLLVHFYVRIFAKMYNFIMFTLNLNYSRNQNLVREIQMIVLRKPWKKLDFQK